jgi:hypothetical protein
MRFLLFYFFLFSSSSSFSQKKTCACDNDSLEGRSINCRTIVLKNKARLYWQYNCDSAWLTLQTSKGKKIVLDTLPAGLFYYTFRMGFQLFKEFEHYLVLRSECPANGPCKYSLVDKNNGKKIKTVSQLICAEGKTYDFDFIVYFTPAYDQLVVYFVDSKKTISVPFNHTKLNVLVPEFQFSKMKVVNNILQLFYQNDDGKHHRFCVRLKK